MTPRVRRNPRTAYRLLGLLLLALLPGCGGEEVVRLQDYLEELEFERPLEAMKELKVNSYVFPCAARRRDSVGADLPPLWVQLNFELFVIVAEENETAVSASIERHQGLLDDMVLSICRRSSLDQLQDNNWRMIKTRLLDEIRPLLGKDRVQQLVVSYSAPWEPI